MTETIAPVLGEATVEELRQGVRGDIVTPDDPAYDAAARIWNGMHDGHRPAVIVRWAGAGDVIAAVGFARSNHLAIAVRGGAHSIAGFSTCDDGIVIDLSALRYVHVDPDCGRAYVGGGAVWADVDHETQAPGLATTGGMVSTTGVAGFTLGGGIGWLMRKHGLACDNLVAATVVTADGRVGHASESEHAELRWALRGAAATSVSSPSSNWQCIPSGQPCTPGRSSTRPSTAQSSCVCSATGPHTHQTTSRRFLT